MSINQNSTTTTSQLPGRSNVAGGPTRLSLTYVYVTRPGMFGKGGSVTSA
jgi:hypothetical protein